MPPTPAVQAPRLRWLGRVEYEPTWRAMQRFTDERTRETRDEIWFLEHPPVFTMGMNASAAHLLAPGDIPVVNIDRGGQVTYHGPGQLVVYPLLDLARYARFRQTVDALPGASADLGTVALAPETAIAGRVLGTGDRPLAASFEQATFLLQKGDRP